MIGVIVDGEGDHSALRARYGHVIKVLKASGPRGHTVSEVALVKAIKKEVAILMAFGCTTIAVLTDFEGRATSASNFCRAASTHASRACGADVTVLIADQMIENWYLADIAHLSTQKSYLREVRRQKRYESTHGKKELKKIFKQGSDYNEVKHGAELFPLVRGDEAAKISPSFAQFRQFLGLA